MGEGRTQRTEIPITECCSSGSLMKTGMKYSSLVFFDQWADGHYDVTEMEYARREGEQEMIEEFENSEEYI